MGTRHTITATAAAVALLAAAPAATAAGRTELERVAHHVQAQLKGKGLEKRHLPTCADHDGTATSAELGDLEWLAGDWKGTGWTVGETGVLEYIQTEHVRPVAGGSVLDITGTGLDPVRGQDVVFSAHATARYDAATGTYVWTAESGGHTMVVDLEVGEGTWAWEIAYGPTVVIRYETTSSHGGRAWHETGEMTVDGGRTWQPMLDMTLVKTCDA